MIRKCGKFEFGDVTIIVDSDDTIAREAYKAVIELGWEINGVDIQNMAMGHTRFPGHKEYDDFMEVSSSLIPDFLAILNPESAVRPGDARDFIKRVGDLAIAGKKVAVFTHDYFIYSYACIMTKYHKRFWPDYAVVDWRFNYRRPNGDNAVSITDPGSDDAFLNDTSIGLEFDRIYDLEVTLKFQNMEG